VQLVPVAAEFVGEVGSGTRKCTYFGATKPDSFLKGPFAFNDRSDIAADGYATVRIPATTPILAKLNPSIVIGDAWDIRLSPVANQWYLDIGSDFDFGGVFSDFPAYSDIGFVLGRPSGTVAAKITETGYSGVETAVYRTSHPYGFAVQRLDANLDTVGEELTCYGDLMNGVHWTNALIWMFRWGGKWQVVNTGAFYWSQWTWPTGPAAAKALEDILGMPSPSPGLVQLWDGGPEVDAYCAWDVASGQAVDVQFDDQQQIFVITGVSCP
jgi:hypothetical protein